MTTPGPPAGPTGPEPDRRPPPPRAQPPAPPAQAAPAGAAAGTGWYSGPLPVAGLAPRETIGAAIGRTAVKAVTALVVLGLGLLLVPFLLIAIGATVAGVAGGTDTSGLPRELIVGERGADVQLVAVPVTGVILGEDRGGGGLFSAADLTYGYTIKEQLAELADDDSVDGIVLEMDTPGGTIFGAKAIADGVAAYREKTDKPVVAHVSGISASGGMYAMAGADTIYADHGTLIGSIGVIFGPFASYDGVTAIDGGILGGGVTTEGGIDVEYLTAGRNKDLGNPYRPLNDEERAVLQEGLDDAYDEFVDHVSTNRDLPAAEIEKELGAMLFGEQQALGNGLIDGVANRDESFRLAAEAAGLADDDTWSVERLQTSEPGLLDLLAASAEDRLAGGASDSAGTGARADFGHPLCLGSGTVLAHHGDPSRLCLPG